MLNLYSTGIILCRCRGYLWGYTRRLSACLLLLFLHTRCLFLASCRPSVLLFLQDRSVLCFSAVALLRARMKLERVHCRVTALATSSPHVAFDISELGLLGFISSPTVRFVPFSCGWNTHRQHLSAVNSVNSAATKGLILMTNGSKTRHFSVRCLEEMGWSELETLMSSNNPPRQQQWPSPALKLPFQVLSTCSGSFPHQLFVLLLEGPCTVATCEQNKMLIIIKFPLLCVRSEKCHLLCGKKTGILR